MPDKIRNMKKKLLAFFTCMIILLITNPLSTSAHSGGHYHHGDGTIYNTWQLKNGNTLKGNFLMNKGDILYLEKEDGKLLAVQIQNLSIQDQKLAKFKINKLNQINYNFEITNSSTSNSTLLITILQYLLIILTPLLLFKIFKPILFNKYILKNNLNLLGISLLAIATVAFACSKSATPNNTNGNTNNNNNTNATIPKTSIGFIDSAFTPYKPSITTKWDDSYFYIGSTGIPSHNMMIGITTWQQQVPISQPYTDNNSWSIPLQPVYATTPLSTKTNLMKGAVAVAVNGIPIFNALNNRGEDSYLIGELDNWGGHCGRGDDYHYHAAPLHLSTTSGLKPIAFALDGFPVYGSKEPDGSIMIALDSCHGHVGSNNIYHYHGTSDYPYVVGAMRGKVNLDPSTPAPENQILPQAFTKPVRPATSPLRGAFITDFVAVGTNGYLLTYKIGLKTGYVRYSWDLNNKYTYTLTDTGGIVTTTSYQR
jgi:hypothetical protein